MKHCKSGTVVRWHCSFDVMTSADVSDNLVSIPRPHSVFLFLFSHSAYSESVRQWGARRGGGLFRRPRTTTARRTAVCRRTLTFTLLASQLDTTEPEVVYLGQPWPLGPIACPPRTIRRPYWPKYHKNEGHRALGGQTESGNMAATRYFNSATTRLPIPPNYNGATSSRKKCRTLTFTLLASQLDANEPEVVYRGRPWPLGPIAWPSRTIRRPYRPKYCKNERQGAAGGETGSGNMAATRCFDSATPTSNSTSYTPERRRRDVEP